MKCPFCGKELPADRLEFVPENCQKQAESETVVESVYPDVWLHYSQYRDYFKG